MKKLTPQEKKRLSYKKDHRTHTGESNRDMRKAWASRKTRVNRKYRRKADAALQKAIGPERIDALKKGDDETTRELIKKGLTREKNYKRGVRNLKEALESLSESRTESIERRAKRRAVVIQQFKENVRAFENNPESFSDDEVRWLAFQSRSSELRAFLRDHPSWISRLRRKIDEVQKQKRKAAEKARVKAEEKWKWRSPALRLPRNLNSGEKNEQ